ncbi:DDE-type integrase/transposase/recombinase [Pseudonocardia sp. EC080625-04]|uniref:DDE-type integrase/transposase/recombinase n=1 Tax=Pseudonocardia sp. EC080625-04 TaxID=1096868 RepID=UPI0009E814C9|nr:DDE-type integrase/transposase/recombinase [Pseudonocardia sp. EC080625-04]
MAACTRRGHARAGAGGQPQARRQVDARGRHPGRLYRRRRRRGCTVRDPHAEPYTDLVDRDFTVDGPDELWCTDITEHPTEEGKVSCAAVLDAYSRRVVGWSIDDNMRTELVTDALGMAITRRSPEPYSAILHSDHGSQFTSWAFGRRLIEAGLVGSMGSAGDCYNSMVKSFWGTMNRPGWWRGS